MNRIRLYNRLVLMTFVILSLTILTETLLAQGPRRGNQNGNGVCIDSLPMQELSDFEKNSLLFMREEEKLAHDVYQRLYEKWQARVFTNIARSEQQHTSMIGKLINKYNLTDPYQDEVGVFTNPELQQLFHELVAAGSTSLIDAYKVGATIEDLDIYDLLTALEAIDNLDMRVVYQNLMKGSRNHLRSFYRLLSENGVTYVAQYISPELLEKIVTTPWERGPVDADGNPVGNARQGRGRGRGHGQGPRNGAGDGTCNRDNPGGVKGSQAAIRLGNYPNPANPTTQIVYELTAAAPVKLAIYNVQGQLIRTYNMGHQAAGSYQQVWDARNAAGEQVPSGTYFYRLQVGAQSVTRQLSLIK